MSYFAGDGNKNKGVAAGHHQTEARFALMNLFCIPLLFCVTEGSAASCGSRNSITIDHCGGKGNIDGLASTHTAIRYTSKVNVMVLPETEPETGPVTVG